MYRRPVSPKDDVIQAAVAGDPKARGAVGSWLGLKLRRFFAHSFHDPDKIGELLQATMIVVWSKLEAKAPRDAAELLDFSVRVAVTNSKAARRIIAQDQARKARIAREPRESPRSLSSTLRHVETLNTMEQCIARLTTPYRVVVRGLLAEESPQSLADACGVSVQTIYWRKHEAERQLRKMMEAEGMISPRSGRE